MSSPSDPDGPDTDPVSAGPPADPESVARKILLDQLTGRARSRKELADKLASRNVPDEVAWRWLAMLHFSPRDSLRVLAQNTWAARRDDGITRLPAWNERQIHRSVLYRYRWKHGRTISAGYVDDRMPLERSSTRALTVQLQWEV